ncbi:MAG: hypothetical protein QG604_94 [Candidatus Dependentiae bacterium]|nr:hypothetical protein [Candidatus Dependentiae bacterium]
MKEGFIFCALLLATYVLCTMVLLSVKTVGMGNAALRAQIAEWGSFSQLCVAIRYQEWLITHGYESLLAQSAKQKQCVVCTTPFDANLQCGVAAAWKAKTTFAGLLCQTIVGAKKCRWRAIKEGGAYVFSGHTITFV